MQNFLNRLIKYLDSFGDQLDQGWATRPSQNYCLYYQGELISITLLGKKVK